MRDWAAGAAEDRSAGAPPEDVPPEADPPEDDEAEHEHPGEDRVLDGNVG